MNKRIITCWLCAVLLLACAAPVCAFDVPEYKFDGPKNDELYAVPGIASAESGIQVVLPDDSKNEILPYGVTLIGPSYAGSADGAQASDSSNRFTISTAGYPDVWSGVSGDYDPIAINQPPVPAPDVSMDVLRQKDGSLGSLSIPGINMSAKLFENEMSRGVGHIPGTAYWNGNIGLMGHNRGTNNYFARINELKSGDIITLTTKQGTRSYAVTFNGSISATDWTMLQSTQDNRLTLITCIANTPSLRRCIQAAEIR